MKYTFTILVLIYSYLFSNSIFAEKIKGSPNNNYYCSIPKYDIGETVQVGYFQYTIDKIEFTRNVSNGLNSKTTNGIFLIAYLTVTNTNRESRTLTNTMFKIFDSEGYEYGTSQDAMIVMILNDKDKIFMLKEFPPKISKEIIIPFEVPKQDDFYTLEVSGGFGTGKRSYIKINKVKP